MLLWVYAFICTAIIVSCFVLASVIGNGGGVRGYIESHCDELIVTMDEQWFEGGLGCSKYVGESEWYDHRMGFEHSKNPEALAALKNPNLSASQLEKIIWNDPFRWQTKKGPGSVASCADQSTTKFAWEYNLGLYRSDDDIKPVSWDGSERDDGPHFDADGKTVAYYGCINRDCCGLIAAAYESHTMWLEFALGIMGLLLLMAALSALYVASVKAKLHKQGYEDDSPILLHSQDTCILILIIIIFVAGIAGGVYFLTGGALIQNTMTSSDMNSMSDLTLTISKRPAGTTRVCYSAGSSVTAGSLVLSGGNGWGTIAKSNTSLAFVSVESAETTCSNCTNGVQDEGELGIDCGGPCSSLCGEGGRCATASDCDGNLICDNQRCTRPSAARETLCTNNKRDVLPGHVESDVDCGMDCGSMDVPSLCGLDRTCSTSDDCEGGTSVVCTEDRTCAECGAGALACGGDCPNKCEDGQTCSATRDCGGGNGTAVCFLGECASCHDGVKSGDETGIDCGTALRSPANGLASIVAGGNPPSLGCPACADGQGCLHDLDCSENSVCDTLSGVCVSCTNGVQDGNETCVDGGGAHCGAVCEVGHNCSSSMDCQTHVCLGGVCAKPVDVNSTLCVEGSEDSWPVACYAPSCRDGVLTIGAGETGVDCGGPSCRLIGEACPDGVSCRYGADCESGSCYKSNADDDLGKCTSCSNSALDPGEIGIDCSGTCTKRCGVGQACAADGDCVTGARCENETCVSCSDGIQNQGELCVDGGGPVCGAQQDLRCNSGDTCEDAARDCAGGTSNARCVDGFCASCGNSIKDGDETCVDGGGSCLPKQCSLGDGCGTHTDCSTGWCNTTASPAVCSAVPAAVACSDGVKDPLEACIDGGGPVCGGQLGLTCADHDTCTTHADCTSGVCNTASGHCGDPCLDGVTNFGEAGPDCGGTSACGKCADGVACVDGRRDCRSGFCSNITSTCVSCNDGIRNLGEACVDGGGLVCGATCATGKRCTKDGDCSRGLFCHVADPLVNELKLALQNLGVEPLTATFLASPAQKVGATALVNTLQVASPTSGSGGRFQAAMAQPFSPLVGGLPQTGRNSLPPLGSPLRMTRLMAAGPSTAGVCSGCGNGVKDGLETDVDCGGGGRCALHKCGVGKACFAHSDCESGHCALFAGVCVARTTGHIVVAVPKKDLEACTADDQCENGRCDDDTSTCGSCHDGVKNGDEAGVDCGHTACPLSKCPHSVNCTTALDCESNRCEGGLW